MMEEQLKKAWIGAGVISYLGILLGILVITLFLPLSFILMGETNAVLIAQHCGSFKMVVYWIIGIGGITILFYLLSGLATIFKGKWFTFFCTFLTFLHILIVFGLMIWGLINSGARKDYLREMWKGMNETTVDLLQNHYSCCGFEKASEFRFIPDSCYAVKEQSILWPDGCYEKTVSISLETPKITNNITGKTVAIETKSQNPLLAAFAMLIVLLLLVSITALLLFSYVAVKTSFENLPKRPTSNEVLLKNKNFAMNGNTFANSSQNTIMTSNDLTTVTESVEKPSTPTSSSETSSESESDETENKCFKVTNAMAYFMEEAFYSFGVMVGRNPKKTIVLSLIVAVALSVGLLQRREQPRGGQSFLPAKLEILDQYTAYLIYFQARERLQQILILGDEDVLTSDVFKKTVDLDTKIKDMVSSENNTLSDICQSFGGTCNQQSLMELWNFNQTVLAGVTKYDIIQKINEPNLTSPIFKIPLKIDSIIGGLNRDDSGQIQLAKAHLIEYTTFVDDDAWEDKFVTLVQEFDGLSLHVKAESSRNKAAGASYTKELPLLFAGFALVFLYISVMTGKFSLIKHRVWIALLGVLTAGLSLSSGIGLAASITFEWTVLHLIGPFLVIGIGVDDMFILLQTWNTIDNNPALQHLSVHERAGFCLKSAGVSITITSVTDLVAFAVGATSQLRAFESFSIYTALCIVLLFAFQCTFFLACTVLDQQRRDNMRDACCCCIQYDPTYVEGKCANKEYFQRFFENVLGWGLTFKAVKAVALILTLALSGVMAWGFSKLEVGYDPDWYLPSDSYVIDFNKNVDEYFSSGVKSDVFVINADFYEEREKLTKLYNILENNTDVDNIYLESWYESYKKWENATSANRMAFYASIRTFINSEAGRNYKYDVVFSRTGELKASKFPFRHRETKRGVEEVAIVDSLRKDINSVGFSNFSFPYARVYFNYEIIKIIQGEVYKNLGITMLCVFIMVLPMIASLQMSLWVVLCVVFTILDVAGTMYFIGLYIETSTIITLLLTVGLAVDYAAHIAHKFLTVRGSRNMRMRVALSHVGPAVFNGGFSTFLALSLLAGSDTYSYKVFFTIFTCVVFYGLWNGLIFLPAVLGFIGPPAHATAIKAELHPFTVANDNKVQNTSENPYASNDIERT